MTKLMGHITAIVVVLVLVDIGTCRTIVKREDSIDPIQIQEQTVDQTVRDKRAVDVVTGVKNAVLGFVFNKLNAFIDQKTHWIDQLDKQNIAKNAAANIVPPADPITSLSSVISGAIGQKIEAAAPLLNVVTSKLGGLSSGGGGFNIGSLISKGFGSSSSGSSGGSSGGGASHDSK